ncbi:hypothetical protein DPMN_126173 [Dreissena polymorpha]|uniref:Uncharacterized protein n=1 Tax=Dreissena polymorpha TaxID=45954 RepID=A0A9D4GYV6_DREPO|nr:hypothetical protein DPMN_126173 [Dreissena polymorpha]
MCGDVELNPGPPKTSTERKRVSPISRGACGGPSDMDPRHARTPEGASHAPAPVGSRKWIFHGAKVQHMMDRIQYNGVYLHIRTLLNHHSCKASHGTDR